MKVKDWVDNVIHANSNKEELDKARKQNRVKDGCIIGLLGGSIIMSYITIDTRKRMKEKLLSLDENERRLNNLEKKMREAGLMKDDESIPADFSEC